MMDRRKGCICTSNGNWGNHPQQVLVWGMTSVGFLLIIIRTCCHFGCHNCSNSVYLYCLGSSDCQTYRFQPPGKNSHTPHHSHGSHVFNIVLSDATAVICQRSGKMSKNILKQKEMPPECIFPSWRHVDTPGIVWILKMLGPVSLTSCSWNFGLNHLGIDACNIRPWNMCGPTS